MIPNSESRPINALFLSPRKESTSRAVAEIALERLESESFEIHRIALRDYHVAPCNSCQVCYDGSPCPIGDDMDYFYRLLDSDSPLLIATPVYFYGLPANAKALVDRCQLFWARKYLLNREMPGGKTAIIAVGGSGGKKLFSGIRLTLKYFLDTLSRAMPPGLFFRNLENPGDIDAEIISKTREYAENFIERLRE